MTKYYFDFSMRNGLATLVDDAKETIYPTPPTIRSLFDGHKDNDGRTWRLEPGDYLFCEAPFSAFDLKERAAIIELAQERGIFFMTMPTKATLRARRWLVAEGVLQSEQKKKGPDGDVQDAWAIRRYVEKENGDYSHLHVVHAPDPAMVSKRIAANDKLMKMRSDLTYELKESKRKKQLKQPWEIFNAKDDYARKLIQHLPPFETLDEVKQKALGDGKEYSLVAVAAVGVVAEVAENLREFDRLAGLHANAYPSMVRAELHHHLWAGANERSKLLRDPATGQSYSPARRKDGLTMTEFKRSLRWLYRQLRPVVSS